MAGAARAPRAAATVLAATAQARIATPVPASTAFAAAARNARLCGLGLAGGALITMIAACAASYALLAGFLCWTVPQFWYALWGAYEYW